ncbi:MAG: tyrosine-type recombinase/integrase [Bilophila wadsworthia]
MFPDRRQKAQSGPGRRRQSVRRHPHTMRHTFASWLAQSGKVTLMGLQKLMRHKNITMTMRYAHLFPGQENEKLSIIGDILV